MGRKTYKLLEYDEDKPNVPVIVDAPLYSPQWAFQGTSGDCADGKFVADSDSSAATQNVLLARKNAGGSDSSYLSGVTVGSVMVFTDTTGKTASFTITSMNTETGAGCFMVGVMFLGGELTWSGLYSISFAPTV